MKKLVFLLCFASIEIIAFSQVPLRYTNLIKKAEDFYHEKNYRQSAQAYSQAFRVNPLKAAEADRYKAAYVWTMAEVPDSAFVQLNYLALSGSLNFEQVTTDRNLRALHKNPGWKPLLDVIRYKEAQREALTNKPLIKQLDSIFNDDQNDRLALDEMEKKYGSNSLEVKRLWKSIHRKDSINLKKVKAILDGEGWLGPDVIGAKGTTTLFLVIQHADLKTQLEYLPLMREAVKNGQAMPDQLALLEDRVALGQGKKQIYGSQISTDPKTGKYILSPLEDPAHVDKRRSEVGLRPLQEYLKRWGIVFGDVPASEAAPPAKASRAKIISNDFEKAEVIEDSVTGPFEVSSGHGTFLDFKLNDFIKENNSAWFKFTIYRDTMLTFDLVPFDPTDDYDFLIFKCPHVACIDEIRSGIVWPDRWCFSVNYGNYGSTGVSEYAVESMVGPGPGFAYVSGVPVKAGETIYLMVNYPEYRNKRPQGFMLYFYNYWPKKPKELLIKRIPKPVSVKKPVVLENVLFESDKATLAEKPDSALIQLLMLLRFNKSVTIEIRGHTDNSGDEAKNQKLSEGRAKAIADYLISKYIDKNRLYYKGFGSKLPLAPNTTEEGRRKNRRVEFVILTQ